MPTKFRYGEGVGYLCQESAERFNVSLCLGHD